MTVFRIGTRGSELALWQARTVAARLAQRGCRTEIVVIKTTGDRLQQGLLADSGGRRLFVKEIEDALLAGHVDVAVHSAKDMPSEVPDALMIAAALPREDPRDALVLPDLRPGSGQAGGPPPCEWIDVMGRLGESCTIGTTSVRRIAQLQRALAGARFVPLRGNVDTRLRRLDEGEFDAIVLAAAGLKRLGFGYRISAAVPVTVSIPAPGQGIVAVQIRRENGPAREAVAAMNDPSAFACLEAERAVVTRLGGGCQLPLGVIAVPLGTCLRIEAFVGSLDGSERITATTQGPIENAMLLGRIAADELAAGGALRLLDAARASTPNSQLPTPTLP